MCRIPHELVGGLETNLHGYKIGGMRKTFSLGDFALIFKVTAELCQIGAFLVGLVGEHLFSLKQCII